MFVKILFSYLIGYLSIEIEGYYIERYINICRNQGIVIWHLNRKEDVKMVFRARIQDFRELIRIAKKTKCRLKIKSKKGLPFLFQKYKKRKIFLILLVVLAFFIILFSNFVWNVEIQVEDNLEIANIEEDIKNAGLDIGKLKSKVDTKSIINEIRLKRDDVAWMGIEIKGTNAIVKLVKADEKPEIIDDDEYCSIISDKAGVITKINAQTGTANVKVGDTVNVGDTLINGWMEGKYTGIRYVHAKGEIEAKVWYTKYKNVSYNATERSETGNTETKYAIKFNNFKINFSKGLSKFEIYDTIETESKMKLFSDFYLPVSIVKTTYKEIEEKQKTYSIEEAKNLGIQELEQELNQEIENKEAIVNKNINTYEKEDSVDVYVTYEVLENIGTNEKIVF